MKGIIFMAIALFSYVYAFKAVKQDHQLKLKIEEQEIIKKLWCLPQIIWRSLDTKV